MMDQTRTVLPFLCLDCALNMADRSGILLLAAASDEHVPIWLPFIVDAANHLSYRMPTTTRVQGKKQALSGAMRIAVENNAGAWYNFFRSSPLARPHHLFVGLATTQTNALKGIAVLHQPSPSTPSTYSETSTSTLAWADPALSLSMYRLTPAG